MDRRRTAACTTGPDRPRTLRRLIATAGTLALATAALGLVTHTGPLASAATPKYSPIGSVEVFAQDVGGLYVRGWTIDPSSPARSLTVYTTVDGKRTTMSTASLARPDIAATHAGAGAAHGFRFTTLVPSGKHTVCVWATNIYSGANSSLGCVTRTLNYSPAGAVDYVRSARGALTIKGWAADRDAQTTPLTLRVTVDKKVTSLLASQTDTRAAKVWPNAGTAHGYSATLPVAQGKHTVCVVAQNLLYGSDTNFGCRSVVLDERPSVHLDVLGQRSGKLEMRGWAFDVDKPTTPLAVAFTVDGKASTVTASAVRTDVAKAYPSAGAKHGFDVIRTLAEGSHRVKIVAHNLDLGSDRVLTDTTVRLNFTPTASLVSLTGTTGSVRAQGWATDPDTTAPIKVQLTVDGKLRMTVTADHQGPKGAKNPGRNFGQDIPLVSGTHTVCAIAVNALYGTHNSTSSCRKATIVNSPVGKFETATRDTRSTGIKVTGWALDQDTTGALKVAVTIDGKAAPDLVASAARPDVAKLYPAEGTGHGIATVLPTTDGEHRVCLTARNVSGGKDLSLGCKVVIAVHPVAPGAPRSVKATGGYEAATVSWTPPATDGGAPASGYTVTATPGGRSVTVSGTTTKATVTGLARTTSYYFTVVAVNVAGRSAGARSATVKTLAGPAPQKTPAPVATSRYIRNISGSSAAELARMKAEGVADAKANPSNHRYLVLLDIGGQDAYDGGVVLSATTRFVSYTNLVRDINAYVDGYHSAQHGTAPATIAIGTNNDMDVSGSTGTAWATRVVNPVASHAAGYAGLSIAGANDVEPGFRAGYTATRNWLSGYLAHTSRPFVFNGSADGCAWTTTNRACNNGWSMSRLYTMAAGASPSRIVNLPQIYNTTMAAQWKYISLTGVVQGHSRINFGGPLTEWTACRQTNSCGSLAGRTAWSTMWSNLQSDSRLRVSSLPYATDLRIDR